MDLPFASELIGLTTSQIKNKARKGTFPAFKVGERSWRVKKDDLLDWIEKQKMSPAFQESA